MFQLLGCFGGALATIYQKNLRSSCWRGFKPRQRRVVVAVRKKIA